MTYRNGVYVVFHAEGESNPAKSDMTYYNTLRMWRDNANIEFSFSNSHEKVGQVRDTSMRSTLESSLKQRLSKSKVVLLIATEATRRDSDWVPFELNYATAKLGLPIVVAYPKVGPVLSPASLERLLPDALRQRMAQGIARVLHIPFAMKPIREAITTISVHEPVDWTNAVYTREMYELWGMLPTLRLPPLPPATKPANPSAGRNALPRAITMNAIARYARPASGGLGDKALILGNALAHPPPSDTQGILLGRELTDSREKSERQRRLEIARLLYPNDG